MVELRNDITICFYGSIFFNYSLWCFICSNKI